MKINWKRIFLSIIIECYIILFLCTNNIYFPSKEVYETKYPHENVYFKTIDDKKLNAWYVPPKKEYPIIMFSHGNGGNISYFFDMLIPVANMGYGVFIYDYRGYGKSEGFPFEKGLYKDARAALNFLNNEKNIKSENIILWGLSIGGGVTSQIAIEDDFKAVILQSTFTNTRDMGKATLKRVTKKDWLQNLVYFVPFIQKFDNYSRIDKITEPLLIVHSIDDSMIPYYQAIKNNKKSKNGEFSLVNGDDHNDYENSLPVIVDFLEKIRFK